MAILAPEPRPLLEPDPDPEALKAEAEELAEDCVDVLLDVAVLLEVSSGANVEVTITVDGVGVLLFEVGGV